MEYLLKASVILSLFYFSYKLFLQKETFFVSNRWFFFIGLFLSIVIPFVVIPIYVVKATPIISEFIVPNTITNIEEQGSLINMEQLFLLIYAIGVLFFLGQFIVHFISLISLLIRNTSKKDLNYNLIEIDDDVSPFSFFNWIVYNPTQFSPTELQQIVVHEKAHADQLHSLDIICSQLATIIFWFNPFVWLYKKDLEQNLEFIADQSTQQQTSCQKSYQHLLLKTSVPKYQLVLANNFYNSLIKKRIVMLHKNKSNKKNQIKFLVMLPVLALFIMSFNTEEVIQYEDANENETMAISEKGDDIEVVMITKNSSDDYLDDIVDDLKKKDITIKFKGVKRNKANEITDISISAKTEKASANINESNDDGISPIKLTIQGNSISFGNSHNIHEDGDMMFISKDGNHKIRSSDKGASVFVFSDEEHEHDEDEEYEHEIIEDDNKIIIKNGKKIHEIKKIHKNKGKNVFVIKGDGGEVIDLKDKDGNVFIVKKDKKGNVVKEWIHDEDEDVEWKDEEGKSFKIRTAGKGGNKLFISNDSDKKPMMILDGKEISSEDFEKLDTDKIEKVEVLKGESATKKYGEKGKDGVIIITSKKD